MCSYHLLPVGNPYWLHITQSATTLTLSYHHRWYCCASIVHSVSRWLIVSSLSLHNLYRGETLSSLLFILFLLNTWSCLTINVPSVSFFSVPVFSQFQVSWLFSVVFFINCEFNDFYVNFLFLAFRASFLVFLFSSPPRIPSPSKACSSLSLLLSTCFFGLSVSVSTHIIFNTNHSPSTIVLGYVEPINISFRVGLLHFLHFLPSWHPFCSCDNNLSVIGW